MMTNTRNVDIIILSYAHNSELLQITHDCLTSLLASEDPEKIKFNVVVVESQKNLPAYRYSNTITICPEQAFGYNRYLNLGIQSTKSAYVCVCNNDLIFYPHWASEILRQMDSHPYLSSVSPFSPKYHPNIGLPANKEVLQGYRVGYEVAGWCLFFRREMIKIIGLFDGNYEFGGADYDYAYTLWVSNLQHALITNSFVDHLQGRTLQTQTEERQQVLTKDVIYHIKKWASRLSPGPVDSYPAATSTGQQFQQKE